MPADPADLSASARARYYAANLALRAVIGAIGLLPYRRRIPAMGWLVSRLAPLAGFDKRVRHNLTLARPDLPETEVRRLCRAVPDNAGRYLMEMFSGAEFVTRASGSPIEGPGLAALEEARATGRPVILVTGHFGNYDAARAALVGRGFDLRVGDGVDRHRFGAQLGVRAHHPVARGAGADYHGSGRWPTGHAGADDRGVCRSV